MLIKRHFKSPPSPPPPLPNHSPLTPSFTPAGAFSPCPLLTCKAIMGYKLRTTDWAYTVWFEFDWGQGNDPTGAASRPVVSNVTAAELYDHRGDDGTIASSERFEFDNLAYNASYATLINDPGGLHDQLLAAMATGLKRPMLARG